MKCPLTNTHFRPTFRDWERSELFPDQMSLFLRLVELLVADYRRWTTPRTGKTRVANVMAVDLADPSSFIWKSGDGERVKQAHALSTLPLCYSVVLSFSAVALPNNQPLWCASGEIEKKNWKETEEKEWNGVWKFEESRSAADNLACGRASARARAVPWFTILQEFPTCCGALH